MLKNKIAIFSKCSASAGVLALCGCTMIPDYENPDETYGRQKLDTPQFKHAAGFGKSAKPSDDMPKGRWWAVFGDEKLEHLIKLCDANNPDIAAAFQRVEGAREAAFMNESELYPHLSSTDYYKRDGRTENQAPVATGTYSSWVVGLGVTWDLDLFGRIQSLVIRDRALAEATYADYKNAMLALHARVATEYFALRQCESEIELLQKTLEVRKRQSDFVAKRKMLKFASGVDLSRAKLQESEAASELKSLQRQRDARANTLAILVGESPTKFDFKCSPLSESLPKIPSVIPSELLERRPDIAAAEREVFAANAKIGSDTAAFFPTVSITGDVGFGANKIENLLGASSLAWGVSPQVYIPIFQAGKIYAQKQTDLAKYRETVERYKSKVLSAIGEVETSLSNLSHMDGEYAERVKTTDYAKQVQNFTQREYELGNQDYFAVSDAQRQALLHEREQIKLLGTRYRQCVALIMSLGGGWTAESDTPPPPKKMYEPAQAEK